MKLHVFLIASIAAAVARGESTSSLRKRELAWGQQEGTFYTLIAATDYSAMQGVEVQQSSEGIANVGFIDTGDWVAYPVNLPTNGKYQFHARISSPESFGSFEILNLEQPDPKTPYATFSGFPATGDYNAFTTIDQTFDLPAGAYTLQIRATSSGFNLLWFSLKSVPASPVEAPVEAPVEFPETDVTPSPTAAPTVKKTTPSPTSAPTLKKTPSPTSAPTVNKTTPSPTSAPTMRKTPSPTSAPTVKAPVEVPVEVPIEQPVEVPVETPVEPPVESPVAFPETVVTPSPTATPREPFFTMIGAVDYEEMAGLDSGASSEVLANLGSFDKDDWATYDISLPYAGTYELMFRVSSPLGEGGFDIMNWDTQQIYGNIDKMPNTGNWQAYQTVSVLVDLPEGAMRMQLKCYNPGMNFLWFVIKSP